MIATATITSLAAGAAAVGCIHTLAGPDHYVPLVALGRHRGWDRRQAAWRTALLGLAHCLASVVLVLAVLASLGSVAAIDVVQSWRGDMAAMLLIGIGIAMSIAALRRSRRWRAHSHAARKVASTKWAMLAVFVLGPCEWLVPAATLAAASHGVGGALVVSAAFSAATIATMAITVQIGLFALPRPRVSAGMGWATGACVAACGCLMLAGL